MDPARTAPGQDERALRRGRTRAFGLTLMVATVALGTACGGGSAGSQPTVAGQTPVPAPTPTPTPSPTPTPTPSPAPTPSPTPAPTPSPTPSPPPPAPAPAQTYSATVTWTTPSVNTDGSSLTDTASYRVEYGTSVSNLNMLVTVPGGSSTSTTINGLVAGTYFFTVTAVNASGVASVRSNPVSRAVP